MIILTTILYLTSRIEVDYNLNYYLLIYSILLTIYLEDILLSMVQWPLWSTSNSIIYKYIYIIAGKGGEEYAIHQPTGIC